MIGSPHDAGVTQSVSQVGSPLNIQIQINKCTDHNILPTLNQTGDSLRLLLFPLPFRGLTGKSHSDKAISLSLYRQLNLLHTYVE